MKNFIKSFISCFMLCFPSFLYGVTIGGEKHPVIGKTETYVVENHPRTNEKEATWYITGGTFLNGGTTLKQDVEKNKVDVIWKEVTNGYLSYSYGNYSGRIIVNPQKDSGEESPPTITPKISISINGPYKTYNDISFSAKYDHSGIYIKGSPEYKWTFNYEGIITTCIGKYANLSFDKVGKLDILLEVSITTSGDNHRTDKAISIINIEDGTLDPPLLHKINGKDKISLIGSNERYIAVTTTNYPNIKYEWNLTYQGTVTNLGNTKNVTHLFKKKGDYQISCKMTNTKTGVYVFANKHIVVGEEYEIQRTEHQKPTYHIRNNDNRLIISCINDNSNQAFLNLSNISYQIYNMSTGRLVDSGFVISGSSIDASDLAKGLYILKLKDETKEKTYKFSIR